MDFIERYGPWAVITGASEGTGRAFARLLASWGIASVLIARRQGPLETLAAEIQDEFGIECATAVIDLSAADAGAKVAAAAGDRDVGLFIANAGGDPFASMFFDRPIEDWQGLVQRNVNTMMACTHHFGLRMRARGRGGLLLVNSGACYASASTMGVYSGTKAFMLGLAEGLWPEMARHGVHVLTLVLSRTDTPEFRRILAANGMPVPDGIADAAEVARIGMERLPFGPVHNWGQGDDQAGMSVQSAAERRARVVAIDAMTSQLFGRTS